METLGPGKYLAKIKSYGLPEVADGKHPKVRVTFETDGGATTTWFGTFHPNAAQYTVEKLVTLGLKSNDLSTLTEPGALNTEATYRVTVADREYQGKTYTEVKYIDLPTASKFKSMNPATAKQSLAQYSGLVAKVRADKGAQSPAPLTMASDGLTKEPFDVGF